MAKERKTTPYQQKLLDPRWQKKRLEILSRDEFACQLCFDAESTLHVHHRYYERDKDPWDYPNEALATLCEACHENQRLIGPDVEARLLRAIRERFFAEEISTLADGFAGMPMLHMSDVQSQALRLWLRNPDHIRTTVQYYLDLVGQGRARGENPDD